MIVTPEARNLARKIWDYNYIKEPLVKSECIFVLGSHDVRIVDHAAKLFLDGWAPWLFFTGGLSAFTATVFDRPEADVFAERARGLGVPAERIIIENKSTNTGENFRFSAEVLNARGLNFNSFILVQKPNMLRRVFATAMKQWPGKKFCMSTHDIGFENSPHEYVTEEMFIHEIVGDLQRVKIYPAIGHQIEQEIPADVWAAYERLISMGFIGNLVKLA